jgi:hypothetical protein
LTGNANIHVASQHCHERDKVELRAYPNNPAARKAIRAQAKCSKPR